MSFKDYLWKKIIPVFFMVVTFVNVGMLVAGTLFFPEERFGYEVFFSPLFFGILGCIPAVLTWFWDEKTVKKSSIVFQTIFQLVVLEICILGTAGIFGEIDIMTGMIMAGMILCIYAAVCIVLYLQDKQFCEEMNQALLQYQNEKR